MRTSSEIRRTFLDHYAKDYGHLEAQSASLVPSSYDPSVLLNIAGMQPFKPYFAGEETPPSTRMTTCQKCFRTPDIEEVGLTARHLTFFEMLGNFSFGDYFKQGAIEMAWDLLINKYEIDPDKLWITIHEGDPKLGLELDTEARDAWLAVGVPADRIVPLGADNFWKAGPTGPCGPSSEIFFDRGPEWGPEGKAGDEGDRYLEIYNLVFMQFSRDAEGNLTELPAKNIDTGGGLERIASVLQDNVSIFEIDSVLPITRWAEQRSGRTYGEDPATDKAMKVLIDHGRGMSFLASDGVTPSNEGRGYVLRRVIRRAIQHADRIGMYPQREAGLLVELHARVVDAFSDHYPELTAQRHIVAELLHAEEERFLRTLDNGQSLFNDAIATLGDAATFPGDIAFQLHDTFGFPVELTQELAGEAGKEVDRARFDELMHEQRERARAAAGGGSLPTEQAAKLVRSVDRSEFVGYDELVVDTEITAMQAVEGGDGDRVLIKLARSPFYAEGGGQVADAGTITSARGQATIEAVLRFETDQVIVAALDGHLEAGEPVRAEVDAAERRATESNHTATHLLHSALRDVLGDHVRQKGSLVEPSRLRFDFAHDAQVTPEQLAQVEAIVGTHIAAGERVQWEELPIDEARERGATALFGEKYGDVVRMVSVGDGKWSLELCGGTHVDNTARIRQVLVTHESSVGGGTRRIEALTGDAATQWLRARAEAALAASRVLGVDFDRIAERADELQKTSRRLEKELSAARSGGALDAALEARAEVGPFAVVAHRDDSLGGDELLDLADKVKGKLGTHGVVILGAASSDGKVALVVSAADDAVHAGAHAGNIIREVATMVGGGGGGRPNMARAGGKDASKLDEALAAGRHALEAIASAASGA